MNIYQLKCLFTRNDSAEAENNYHQEKIEFHLTVHRILHLFASKCHALVLDQCRQATDYRLSNLQAALLYVIWIKQIRVPWQAFLRWKNSPSLYHDDI